MTIGVYDYERSPVGYSRITIVLEEFIVSIANGPKYLPSPLGDDIDYSIGNFTTYKQISYIT